MDSEDYEFDVALSFAGEDRAHAKLLATALSDRGVRVFYDEFSKATLWGKDLYQHLQKIYKDKAQYCIVFVSENYIKKNWTKHELQQAQARSFQSDREYILPLRLDDTALPGVPPTIGYLDLKTVAIDEVAALLLEKLNLSTDGLNVDLGRVSWEGDFVEYNGVMVASFWPKEIEKAQHKPVCLVTVPFDRIRYCDEKRFGKKQNPKEIGPCHDCAALPGQYHVPSCDMEECPNCGKQSISCGCHWEPISLDRLSAWEEGED